jgi:hypothetical protein
MKSCFAVLVAVTLFQISLRAADLPSGAEKAIDRYRSSIDRMLLQLRKDHRSVIAVLEAQRKQAIAKGDNRAVAAIEAEAAELSHQLDEIVNAAEAVQVGVNPAGGAPPIVGAPRVLAIDGADKVGVSLGAMRAGTVITVQYANGSWSNSGLGTSSPDETNQQLMQLCIAGTSAATNLNNDLIVLVPLQTARSPFRYVLQQNYDNVSLRMADDIYNGPGHSDNGGRVFYRVAVGR